MGAIVSHITSLTTVYSFVYSDADQRKHQSTASLAFAGNSPGTGEFPAHMASNAENVSIWWRHRILIMCQVILLEIPVALSGEGHGVSAGITFLIFFSEAYFIINECRPNMIFMQNMVVSGQWLYDK